MVVKHFSVHSGSSIIFEHSSYNVYANFAKRIYYIENIYFLSRLHCFILLFIFIFLLLNTLCLHDI